MIEYYRVCRPAPKGKKTPKKGPSRALAEFAQQLLTSEPGKAARAFVPLVSLFEELLGDAEAAGYIRPGLPRRRTAAVVLEAIMFNAFSTTIGGLSADTNGGNPAEELWNLVFYGIGTGSAS